MTKPFGRNSTNTGRGGETATGGSQILGKLLGGGQQTVGGKSKVPAYVANDLLERLRNTVVGMQRNPNIAVPPVSLSSFVESAILLAIEEAEEEHNGGRPWPTRPNAKLKTGPPIGG